MGCSATEQSKFTKRKQSRQAALGSLCPNFDTPRPAAPRSLSQVSSVPRVALASRPTCLQPGIQPLVTGSFAHGLFLRATHPAIPPGSCLGASKTAPGGLNRGLSAEHQGASEQPPKAWSLTGRRSEPEERRGSQPVSSPLPLGWK